ncbi:MmcB family DNA repair protein [Vineibacter terrae]|uniref:MmcB family DNA repair protein n=1 Tax=Vineibacter terrae TaxID=2586908 RepID=A0A5C8PJN5_9HYPH|nr:MmcB family DNA repair protein [Vineibacter terrae]
MTNLSAGARPEATLAVTRGVCRLWRARAWTPLLEVPLADGRRADVLALADDGTVAIVEVKSSVEDYRADAKWTDYLAWCDRFYFAVGPQFPQALLPDTAGLIMADAFGGDILRDDPRPVAETRLAAGRRKALTLRCARLGAERLQRLIDPQAGLAI